MRHRAGLTRVMAFGAGLARVSVTVRRQTMRALSLQRRSSLVAGLLVVATSVWAGPGKAADDAASLRQGESLLRRDCGGCHAVGRRGESPRAGAPAFRELSRRYDVESLGEALAEGLMTGHPEMPEFRFRPDDVDAILAYLRSIQGPPRR